MKNFLSKRAYSKTHAILASITFILLFIILLVLSSQLVLLFKEPLPKLYYGIFGALSAFLLLFIFLKVEKRTFADVGLQWERRSLLRFLLGILIGIGIFSLMITVLVGFGGMHLQKLKIDSYLKIGLSLLPFIPLALMEELAFRTYPLLLLKSKLGVWHAQWITALLFALYHILMGWPIHIAFMGPFVWSFAFGWSALWFRGIAVPFGFHVALNWTQNLVGMKSETFSIYKLVHENSPTKELVATSDYLGIAMHVVILTLACWLTYVTGSRLKGTLNLN